MTAVDVVIMAAGKGTRMKSRLPKVLHRLAGRALVQHVVDTAAARAGARRIVVVTGNGAAEVEAALTAWAQGRGVAVPAFVRQEPQLGTGHAMQQAAPLLPDDGITADPERRRAADRAVDTCKRLVDRSGGRALALLSVRMPDPTGYGRILRAGDKVQRDRGAQGRDRGAARASARSTPASWRCRPARSSAGWRG